MWDLPGFGEENETKREKQNIHRLAVFVTAQLSLSNIIRLHGPIDQLAKLAGKIAFMSHVASKQIIVNLD